MSHPDRNKDLVRRLVEEVVNRRDDAVLDQVAQAGVAEAARRWISPFRGAFPDFRMRIVSLVAEGDTVVAHLHCSGTHTGEWLGQPPTGRRFRDVDEIYVFRIRDGLLTDVFGVEDNLSRLAQLGMTVTAAGAPAARTPGTAPGRGNGEGR